MMGRKIARAMLPPSIWWEGSVVWVTAKGSQSQQDSEWYHSHTLAMKQQRPTHPVPHPPPVRHLHLLVSGHPATPHRPLVGEKKRPRGGGGLEKDKEASTVERGGRVACCHGAVCACGRCTFAEWRLAGPLGWMTRHTSDCHFTNELKTFIAEEAQRFSCLIMMLVKGLVSVLRDTRVQAGFVFYCEREKGLHSKPGNHPSHTAYGTAKEANQEKWQGHWPPWHTGSSLLGPIVLKVDTPAFSCPKRDQALPPPLTHRHTWALGRST